MVGPDRDYHRLNVKGSRFKVQRQRDSLTRTLLPGTLEGFVVKESSIHSK